MFSIPENGGETDRQRHGIHFERHARMLRTGRDENAIMDTVGKRRSAAADRAAKRS